MSLERAVLTGFPRPATERDYAQAAGELERSLSELPGAVAVYRFGSIRAPGISDLDRLVVVEDSRVVPEIWSSLSAKTHYLAMHTPFLIDAVTFARHRWFAELSDLTLAWGEALTVEERPVPEHCERLLAAEGMVVIALKLAKLSVTGRVKVRSLLCELNNLRLDLVLARLGRADAPAAWALADGVSCLRGEWWGLERADQRSRARSVLGLAPRAVAQALGALAAPVEGRELAESMSLAAEWQNVTLTAGDGENPFAGYSSPFVGRRSGRLAEARWRCVRRQLQVPLPVLSLIRGLPSLRYTDFDLERRDLVRSYSDLLQSNHRYSSIGLARIFLAS
jgi:hypothetical protein